MKAMPEVLHLVTTGQNFIMKGQYIKANESYNKALEYQPGHYLIRNALGELMFIKKEYIAAADNFYLAAFDESYDIDLDALSHDITVNPELLLEKNKVTKAANQLLMSYAKKSGLSLFAHQYDDPTDKNPRQAVINRYRSEIDPYGYCGCTEIETRKMLELDREIEGVGYRFLSMMNERTKINYPIVPPLEKILDVLSFN